jgi:hypothetical protein
VATPLGNRSVLPVLDTLALGSVDMTRDAYVSFVAVALASSAKVDNSLNKSL